MRTLIGVVAIVLLGACEIGEAPPSCQQAVEHYYSSGCGFLNVDTGQPTSENEAIAACGEVNASVPDRCRGRFEIWLSCISDTPAEATNVMQCDCTQESDALVAC